MTSPDDVVIFGGGPAACAAAMLLRRLDYPVVLMTRPHDADRPDLFVSMTPSCRKVLSVVGLLDAVTAADLPASTGNTVWWGTSAPRVEPFGGPDRGWQVSLRQLEAALVPALRAAGVRLVPRAVSPDEATALPARFRLDGTGRTGVLARRLAGRRWTTPHRTVALSAVWDLGRSGALPDASHTLVEGYRDGWAWSVPAGGERRVVAVMVDPQASGLLRGTGAREVYTHELAKTLVFHDLIGTAQLLHGPTGWDASEYCATDYIGPDWLVMGDAASFVDPLSSSGVKKALTSGWLAAVTVHTSLLDPSRVRLAHDFFAAREQEMFDQLQRLTRQFLAAGTPEAAGAFWRDRGTVADDPHADEARAAVEEAWHRIRTSDRLHLVPGELRWTEYPAVRGSEIVPEWRLASPAYPGGLRFLQNVDLRALTEITPHYGEVPGLYSAYCRQAGPVGWSEFLTALSTAVARGWLRWDEALMENAHDAAIR